MTTKEFVMAIDQGTTSTRAIIFNHSGEIVSVGQKEFTQIFPNPGWVEHNPIEIWDTTRQVVADALQKAEINRHQLAAVGITNQRETTVVWDKNTGEPVYNAIVWQDMRTSDIVKELEGDEGPDRFRQICGLGLSPYFSGSKIKWILDNVEGARERAEAGDLYFGNTDSWVLWNLTGGVNGGVHYTDVTNASRTMLMDIRTLQWSARFSAFPCRCCLRSSPPPRSTVTAVRTACSSIRRFRASLVTSRLQPSARLASKKVWQRIPTAPAASC